MNGAADDARVAAEATLPEPKAEDRRMRCAGPVVGSVEGAAEERSYAEYLEEPCAHARAWQLLGLGAIGDRQTRRPEPGQIVERASAITQREKVARREGELIAPDLGKAGSGPHQDDAVVIGVGKWAQENTVHHAQHRGSGADAEREGEQCRRSEAACAAETTHGEAHILTEPAPPIDALGA